MYYLNLVLIKLFVFTYTMYVKPVNMLIGFIRLLAVKKVCTTNINQVSGATESKQQLDTIKHFKID